MGLAKPRTSLQKRSQIKLIKILSVNFFGIKSQKRCELSEVWSQQV